MSEWFQAKVKFLAQQDNGLIKKITELYLIDAGSFTEAETRAFKEADGNREVSAVSITRSPIKEVVFYGDTDMWHKVKVTYSLMDEATEKEKKVTTYFLVNASDVKEAYDRTEEHLKTMLVPFTIPKVEESPICEVFQYEKQAPKGTVKVEKADDKYSSARRTILSMTEAQSKYLYSYAHGNSDMTEDEACEATGLNDFELSECCEYITKESDGSLGEDDDDEFNEEGGIHDEHEEECAMEGDSIEAIDPTDGQAIGFEMDLRAYLMQIRPHDWVKLTTEIEKVWNENPKALQFCLAMNGLSHDEQDHVADILSNEAAFDEDEEANETDLEGRFGLAMKGGVRITDPLWDFLASIEFNALPSDLEEIRHMHQNVQLMDFEGWLLQEYLIEGDNARNVSEFLRRENEAKTQIAD